MITSFALEAVNGTLKKVQHIAYSNGQRVKRIFATNGVIPEEVHIMADKQGTPVSAEEIEHREVQLYRHFFGV